MTLRRVSKYISVMLATVFAVIALAPAASYASVAGRKNTAVGLGALSLYSLMRGKTSQGLLLGAGTWYAYKRYQDERKHRHHRYVYRNGKYYRVSSYRR